MKRNMFIVPILILIMSFASCLDNLFDTESDGTIIIEDVTDSVPMLKSIEEISGLFRVAQSCVVDVDKHKYQAQFNLHIDNYCGYMCLPHTFYGKQQSTYSIAVFGYGVTERFLNFALQVTPIIKSADSLKVPEMRALGEIMFALGSQIMVDAYGAFPYQHYKKMNQEHPVYYYPGQAVYDSIFYHLKESVALLEQFKKKPSEQQATFMKILSEQDCVSGGSVDAWIKFANSLRLRLAMRMSKYDPVRAQKEAEEAIVAGVLTESDNDFAFDYNKTPDVGHPLYKIARTWVDTRLNASFLNILQRLECPLLDEWFLRNAGHADKDGSVIAIDGTVYPGNTDYMGIRSGTPMREQSYTTDYLNYSSLSGGFTFKNIHWMKVCEVLFLRAEGALRGWNMGGTPDELYNSALTLGLKRELLTGRPSAIQTKIDKYLSTESAKTDIHYIDYYDPSNNCDGRISIGVTWNESDDFETKLEKIITQKYILNFPQSMEAWSDLRRTGYPKQLPMVEDGGDGTIEADGIIRRLPFSIFDDDESRQDALVFGCKALGKPDWQGSRIFWDVK